MAESDIQLPADGTGKKVDTRTVTQDGDGDTAHREVVVLGSGASTRVALVTNSQAILTQDYLREVGRGNISGLSLLTKFGRNPAITPASDPEDVWGGGGEYTGHPVSGAETVDVFSSSADDAAAGTGARTVLLAGLDASGAEQTETVALNGTTAVTSSNTWTRCNRQWVATAGSSYTNAGAITVRHTTTTANVFSVMQAGRGQSTIAAYTIPAGKTGYLIGYACSIARTNGSAGAAEMGLMTRATGGDQAWRLRRVHEVSDSLAFDRKLEGGIELPALTDIKWRVFSVSDSTTVATGQFQILLIDD